MFYWKNNKTALNSNDDKRIQPIDSVEAHVCGTTKDIVCKKEETKWNNTARKCEKLLT